jgi:hypothetical protein
MPQNLTYTYPTGPTVAGIVYDGELIPAYYLPNGTLWPAGFYGNGSQIMPKDVSIYSPKSLWGSSADASSARSRNATSNMPINSTYRAWR